MKSKYTLATENKTHLYYHSLLSNKTIKVSKQLINSFDDLEKYDQVNEYLLKNKFLSSLDEDNHWDDYYSETNEKRMQLIIMPHENCNFRCTYCYESFKKNEMAFNVQIAILKFINHTLNENSKIELLIVNWFGGEPLLAKNIIYHLSEKIMQICQKYGVHYEAQITTNGYLLNNETFENLLKHNVTHYQITIDGNKETHDSQRKLLGGQGSYERILTNLISMKESDNTFKVMLRMNVGPDNFHAIEPFVNTIKKYFDKDKRFEIYFQDIRYWGGKNTLNYLTEDLIYTELKNAVRKNVNICNPKIFLEKNSSCFAASPNSFVIGTDGLLYKCTIALYDDINMVGRLNDDGSMELNKEKMNLWVNGGKNDPICHSCNFAPVCHGDSCPLHRLNKNKQPCPTSKYKFKEIIELIDASAMIDAELSLK